MKKRKAIYTGSFDPVTFGHLDLIERALSLFDELIVVVASNPSKKTLFTAEERVGFLKAALKHRPQVKVKHWEGLTVHFAEKEKAFTLIRGIRATSDFDYEFQMALTNRKLAPMIDTVFLMPSESHFYLSSRLIKEIAQLGGDVTRYVPPLVAIRIQKKFPDRNAR
ncbi:MAG: pantetheine-phosphate adenylyltransferase [Candidatus Omnitrophota bacterium]